jgi:hypothetical protein
MAHGTFAGASLDSLLAPPQTERSRPNEI